MPKNIIAIEDEPAIAESLKILLEAAGYAVTLVSTSADLPKIFEHVPDLYLLDIWLKGMTDGREIGRQLKSRPATKNVPVIVVSADQNIEQMAREAEANAFVQKPFQPRALLALVAEHLGIVQKTPSI